MIPTPKSKCFHCWRNYFPNQMAAHLEDCERQRQFMCPIANCGRRFESAHGVNVHAASTHTAQERGTRFHCQQDGCLYGSDDFNALQSHQRRHDVRRGGMRRSLSRDRLADRSRQSSVSRSEAGDQQAIEQERQGRPRERVQPVQQEVPRQGRSRQRQRVQPVQAVHGQENNYDGPLTRARSRSAVRTDSPPVDGQRQQVQEPVGVGNVFGGPQHQHGHGSSSQPNQPEPVGNVFGEPQYGHGSSMQPNRQPEPVGNVFGEPHRQHGHGSTSQPIQPEPVPEQFQQMNEQQKGNSSQMAPPNPPPQPQAPDPVTGKYHLLLIDPEEARRRMASQNAHYDQFMLFMETEYNEMKQLYADHGLGLPITAVNEMEKTLKAYFDKFVPHHSAAQAQAQAHNDEDDQEEEVQEVEQDEAEEGAGQNNNDDEAPNQTMELEEDDDEEILIID